MERHSVFMDWKTYMVKMAILHIQVYRFSVIPITTPAFFFGRNWKANLTHKRWQGQDSDPWLMLQSETVWKEKAKNNREMTLIPKVCSGLILCPGGKERHHGASVLDYKDFWAQRSGLVALWVIMRLLHVSKVIKLLLFKLLVLQWIIFNLLNYKVLVNIEKIKLNIYPGYMQQI